MSADLLAEFDTFYQPASDADDSKPEQSKPQNIHAGVPFRGHGDTDIFEVASSTGQTNVVGGDDDWGDFETAQTEDYSNPAINEPLQDASVVASLRTDTRMFQSPNPETTSALRSSHVRAERSENVLFDAEEDMDEAEEGDDFGNFETAKGNGVFAVDMKKPSHWTQPTNSSLLDDEDGGNFEASPHWPSNSGQGSADEMHLNWTSSSEQPGIFSSDNKLQDWPYTSRNELDFGAQDHPTSKSSYDEYAQSHVVTSQRSEGSGITRSDAQATEEELAWADFDDSPEAPPSQVASRNTQPVQSPSTPVSTPEAFSSNSMGLPLSLAIMQGANSDLTGDALPPTNIPPPALILSLFPPIITSTQTKLLEPLAKTMANRETKEQILKHPTTHEYLKAYLTIVTVIVRVIAGRKLRWKRDTILAQSMRMGPASSSKASGMKLAGIDKTEVAKEDREVSDLVRLWRAQSGRLRSTVTGSGLAFTVPEVSETMPVRIAHTSEGAIVSTKACILCGLKRNERVGKVEGEVQDSFGEWWQEHWGHRTCKNFWDAQKHHLDTH